MSEDVPRDLFIALASRWLKADGKLAFGAPASRLAQVLRLEPPALREKLRELQERVRGLGLEIRSYSEDGEEWYCLCSIAGGPVDIDLISQGVLAVIIRLALDRRTHTIPAGLLKDALVRREYLSEGELQRIIRELDRAGYIRRRKGKITLGFRTKVEFTEQSLQQIREEVSSTIL